MMTNPEHPRRTALYASLVIAALTLSACEVRQEGAQDDPAPVATQTTAEVTPTPSPSESVDSGASILREDIGPEVVVEEPSEPVELTIPFPDGANVNARAERLLASVLQSEALDEDWPVILSGHTDSSGNDQANLRASRSRAEAVAAWLVERGVDDGRITIVAFGEQNPVAPNALPDGTPNEEGRRANRRVEVRIAPPAPSATPTPRPTPRPSTAPAT